ncbi:hypothetical protein DL95DRAFT_362504 [Leptodontidium sp. 2 PMI_412]|nr:hypothetical protein DL95DRAFT_362504 [Leptodontidium sp. 2 PMI_412]
MKHPNILLYFSAISLSSVHACMEFTGVFPFSHTAPFEASIVDNGKHVDLTTVPLPRNGHLPKTQKMEELDWEEIPAWQPWQFECISGYKARANVGMRGFTYVAHGQDFFFVPAMKEDIWGEKWVYSLRLWCGEKDKKGNLVERPKGKEEGGKK